ncbi:hypothetical protein ACGFT2_33670 [Streptomyces sp. NPDC048514]|uniref:hypothetical protein n=1 Tax=Streptomyces sp. NPDC048514 TaxID=3365564 RepID=UPI0037109D8E
MDERIRRYFIWASLAGLLTGAVLGFASGGVFGALVGAGIGAALAAGTVLYWGEHGGARRRRPAYEARPGRVDGGRPMSSRRVPSQRSGVSTGWPYPHY